MNTKATTIAIQGVPGAFHEIAARKIFKDHQLDIVACETFEDLFSAVENKQSDYGIVAVENTIAGTLTGNYHLLCQFNLRIVSEIRIPIEQNLMCLPGQILSDIKEIQSHPVALKQCTNFLAPLQEKGVKIVSAIDTAMSARTIRDGQLAGVAAIGSSLAAEMYELEILTPCIQNNTQNATRFLLIQHINTTEEYITSNAPCKATISFTLPNTQGQLAEVTTVFSNNSLNLTNFILTPIPEKNWEYRFYADLGFTDKKDFDHSIATISKKITDLKILGVYAQC